METVDIKQRAIFLDGVFDRGSMDGGRSPMIEQIAITSRYDINFPKDIMRKLAGMISGTKK